MSEETTTETTETTNWIPEALRDAPFFRAGEDGSVKSAEQVLSDLNHAAQHMGNSLRMPGPDAGEADMAEFQKRVMEKVPGLLKVNPDDPENVAAVLAQLGRPESIDGYKVPEDSQLNPEEVGRLKAIADKANMTQAQWGELLSAQTENVIASRDAVTQAHEAAMAELKGELGAAFDSKKAEAVDFLKANENTPPSIIEALQGDKMPADQVKWLMTLAETIAPEDGQFQAQRSEGSMAVTPTEAIAQVGEITRRLMTEANTLTGPERAALQVKLLKMNYYKDGQRPPSDGELMKVVTG